MNIGVFCASSDRIAQEYYNDALQLGAEIARRSWTLVYGGTNCGLMEEVASAAMLNGGKTIGIVPECICKQGVAADYVTELVVTSDMKERKQMFRDRADAFVALPGGWGTLEEVTEVITLKQLGCHNKPIIFVNTGGFYDLFFKFIRDIREKGFVSCAYNHLYMVVDDVDEALGYIENYKAVEEIAAKYGKNIG